MMWLSLSILVLASTAPCSGLNKETRPTVTLRSGVVVGTSTTILSATTGVAKYIGIPYASSPPLRFGPPEVYASWTSPLDAIETKPACIQQFKYPKDLRRRTRRIFNNPDGTPPAESEDCLYLNVYVPPGTTAHDGKTVMFWIYGGDLQFGDAGLPMYDGSSFAYHQDVVLVTHNYRTNVFGYPNSPELSAKNQNAGFLDQRFALNWVRNNIERFGGSPDRITIFGVSAGGYAVKQLVALPPEPLSFRAAILESQAAIFRGNSTANWEKLVKITNCGQASSPLQCLRRQSARRIKFAIEHHALDFAPVPNEITSTADIRPALAAGTAAKVPIIIGTNKDEGRPFAYLLGLEQPDVNISTAVKALFPGQKIRQQQVKTLYHRQQDSVYIFISGLLTNISFLCPTSLVAAYATKHEYELYRYFFNATFPNTIIFPDPGAYHVSEVPEVFGTYSTKNATSQQIELSRYMQNAWATFAKHPKGGPSWPAYGTERRVANIGGHGINGERIIHPRRIDSYCPIYNPTIKKTGL